MIAEAIRVAKADGWVADQPGEEVGAIDALGDRSRQLYPEMIAEQTANGIG